MEYRQLGETGLKVSTLGFGCGAVGGLLIKGDRQEMVRVVAHAIDQGINYFDTAAIYGNGLSEINLGLVLAELNANVIVGTKVRLLADDLSGNIEAGVIKSVDESLKRLRRDYVDLIQLHNLVSMERQLDRCWVTPDDFEAAMSACKKLKAQGKIGHWGFNGLGETEAIHHAMTGSTQTVQVCYNLLNPTAGWPASAGFPFQDFGRSIDEAAVQKMGVIAIRVLAGGALSGSIIRDANATLAVEPIASSNQFADDVKRSHHFNFLVDEGIVHSLVEEAIRFSISKRAVSTTLVGISNMEQLDQAVEAAIRGPLSVEVLAQITGVWANFA